MLGRHRSAIGLLLLLCSAPATVTHAQSHEVQRLDWKRPGEIVEYRTCGCADACWVAEVKNRRSGRVKLRLQSDCEAVFLTYPGPLQRRETIDDPSGAFDDLRKFPAIIKTLRERLPASAKLAGH